MTERTCVEVRRGAYHDSVTLMQVSRDVVAVDGVHGRPGRDGHRAQPRPAARHGLRPARDAGPNDLVVAVRADDDDALERATAAMEQALAAASAGSSGGDGLGGSEPAPRTVGLGCPAHRRSRPRPGLGARPARLHRGDGRARRRAVGAGVQRQRPVEQEVRLKDEAAARGLLVMGPDCGTAVVGGVGLGFANVVRPGPVGLVAAQRHRRAAADVPARHAPGSASATASASAAATCPPRSAARSTRPALALLDDDPATELIVLVSKPPDPAVAAEITAYAESLATPVLLALLGQGQDDLTTVAAAGGRGRSA